MPKTQPHKHIMRGELRRVVLQIAMPTGLATSRKFTRVTLDQWCSFLEFSVKVGAAPGFEGYEEDGAWPLLLDEYVEQLKADAVP